MGNKYVFVIALALAIVAFDQLTKWYVHHSMQLYQSIPIIDSFFHLTYLRNPGGAFSLFADHSASVRIPFFLTVSVVAVGVLFYFVHGVEPTDRLLLSALGFILGGALGNFVDRLTAGEVIDFLDVHWRGYHWPPFNVADSFITVGTVILVAHSLFAGRTSEARPS